MKTRLRKVYFLAFICLCFSQVADAQRDAGGSAGGNVGPAGGNTQNCVTQPNPTSFKRNNGEGTCGENGEIRLKFNQNPSEAPVLTALMYEDGSPINYIIVPVNGDVSNLAQKGYISYCLLGGNINPAKKIIAVFHYASGCQADAVLFE